MKINSADIVRIICKLYNFKNTLHVSDHILHTFNKFYA